MVGIANPNTLGTIYALSCREGRCALDFGRMKQLHPALARRMLRLAIERVKGNLSGVGLVHLEPLTEFIFSDKTGKSIRIPGGIEAVRDGAKLLIRSKECAAPTGPLDDVLNVQGPGNYFFGKFSFEFRSCDETKTCFGPDSGADCVRMDSDKLKWPLQLRYRRAGDRFRPLGMTGSKKLQDFFTDCMVPKEERQKVPLLCDSEKICWVVGMRMDDRVKVEAHTRQILVVKLLRLSRNGEF